MTWAALFGLWGIGTVALRRMDYSWLGAVFGAMVVGTLAVMGSAWVITALNISKSVNAWGFLGIAVALVAYMVWASDRHA